MGFFRKIPLGTRYAYGFTLVLLTGGIVLFGTHVDSSATTLWFQVTIAAVIHWLITAVYFYWERRWYRFFTLAFSALATGSYIEMTMRAWKQT